MNVKKMAAKIESHFASFNIYITLVLNEIIGDDTRFIFDVRVKKGTKVDPLFGRIHDIREALRLPVLQLYREDGRIRLVVSDKLILENSLRKMLVSPASQRSGKRLPIGLGYDMRGRMFFADLVEFVHAMYGGATNAGKTVGLRSLIISLAALQPVNLVNIVIIDTYTSKLDLFNPLPHLLKPVVKGMGEAIWTLKSLVVEMERRLALPIEELRLLPALVCVIDEYINFIKNLDSGMKLELINALSSLLRLGRQAKIHIILATQEPSKTDMQINLNNVNGRIAFNCSNVYNSVSILREKGAEKLPGEGMMYFKSPDHQELVLLKGSSMPPEEIERLVAHIASKPHDLSKKVELPEIAQTMTPAGNIPFTSTSAINKKKEMADIIMWALSRKTISALQIIREFKMGNRAYDIVDELCRMGIVGEKFHNQQRKVNPDFVEDLSPDVINLLTNCGYTEDDIQKALDDKQINPNDEEFDLTTDSNHSNREPPQRVPKISAMCELENLIGLEIVKVKVKEIATFIERRGKKNTNICLHMCFKGNPGVGKTTVARIIARIFYEAGVIKKNLLVETDRGGLCGQYIGQTAIKTEEKIKKAMGGVLFIDEAYALFSDSEKDYGNEAVATLVKQMEDNRDKFVCILAGYTDEMNSMLNMNPGLTDRIQFYIDFPDYNEHELLQIFEKFCLDNTYELSKSARDTLVSEFSRVIAEKSRNFSNGRYARKIFERVQMKQANRTCDDTITDEDIKAVFAEPDV